MSISMLNIICKKIPYSIELKLSGHSSYVNVTQKMASFSAVLGKYRLKDSWASS